MQLLFDYDNTLAPTEERALGSAARLTNERVLRGVDPFETAVFLERFPGKTYRKILEEIATERGIPLSADEIDELVAVEKQRAIEAFRDSLEPADGSLEMLEAVTVAGHGRSVVSSSVRERLDACLATTGQAKYFSPDRIFSVQSSLPTPVSKPAPDIYLFAMREIGAPLEQYLGLEDAESGMLSMTRAGIIHRVGYVGLYPAEKMELAADNLFRVGATHVIDDLRLLPSLVADIQSGDLARSVRLYGPEVWRA